MRYLINPVKSLLSLFAFILFLFLSYVTTITTHVPLSFEKNILFRLL